MGSSFLPFAPADFRSKPEPVLRARVITLLAQCPGQVVAAGVVAIKALLRGISFWGIVWVIGNIISSIYDHFKYDHLYAAPISSAPQQRLGGGRAGRPELLPARAWV